ncbi:MAG: HNH endonuclease [Bradymonadales bacterium]|nr:MAG: HNH endonuclease [Bradymonadales bacterium]
MRETEGFPEADAAVEYMDPPVVQVENHQKRKAWGIKSENLEGSRRRAASATEAVSPGGRQEAVVQAKSNRSRYIPKAVRAVVWERDAGACVFVEPGSGRACGSSFGLEWDHLREFSRGGDSSEANLRLLCRQHNNRRRIWETASQL